MASATASQLDPVIRHAIGKALATIGAELMNGYTNGAVDTAPAPARRGRPRRVVAVDPTVTAAAADVVAGVAVPVKRGPGRPRKAAPEAAPVVADAPVKRGPGRPRKAPMATPAPIDAGTAPARRGRPRGVAAAATGARGAVVDPTRSVLVRRPGGPKASVYHDAASPCGLVRNPTDNDTITEGEALARGLAPCKRCVAGIAAAA